MSRKSKAQRLADIHALALQQFDDSWNATQDEREDATMDRLFVNQRGAQWAWANGSFDNRVMMEIDHISGEVARIMNERDQNTVTATFMPKDGSDADELADALASRYRADTHDIQGIEARSTAFKGALEGGMGGRRLRAEYENGEDGPQRICLEPINDAESALFFDVNAKRKMKQDAMFAFQITPMTRAAFVTEHGEECADWPKNQTMPLNFPWFSPDFVYVAEYFLKEKGTETFRVFEGYGEEIKEYLEDDLDDDEIEILTATGFTEVEPRVEKIDRVRKYILNGAKVLSDDGIIPGTNIPLIPQYGYWTIIAGKELFRGYVRNKRDGQIAYNVQYSKVVETAAASGIEKPIFAPEQMLGHEHRWQNDNIENNAFMLINLMTDIQGNPIASGPLGYTKSPDIPPAVAALIQMTKQDMLDQAGNQQNTEMINPNVSGIAMEMAQGKADMRSAAFLTAEAEAEQRTAEIWQGMAADIYVEDGRKLKTLTEDGKRGSVMLGKKIFDSKTGEVKPEIDFSRSKMEVVVDVGPKSASKRSAVVRTITSMLPFAVDPMDQKKLLAFATMNMEGEGIQDLRDDARRTLLALGVVKPTKEEQAEIDAAKQPPQPDDQALLAQSLGKEAEAKAVKALADTQLAAAKTKQVEADTAKTLAEIPMADRKQAFEEAKAIAGELNAGQPDTGQPNAE